MTTLKRRFALGGVVASLVLAVVWCLLPTRVPSDQELIARFQTHHSVFIQINEMAAKDIQNDMYLDWSRGNWWFSENKKPPKFSDSRWAEYKKLISQIRPDVESIAIGAGYEGRFVFAGVGGALGRGWCKGIHYVPPGGARGAEDREIEPGWYIFYERFD